MLTRREFLLVHFGFSSIFTRSPWILNVYIAQIPRFGVHEMLVGQSCPSLCDPMDCSPPGSSIHGISQARILEWVAISFWSGNNGIRETAISSSRDLPDPGIEPSPLTSPALAGTFFTASATWEAPCSPQTIPQNIPCVPHRP